MKISIFYHAETIFVVSILEEAFQPFFVQPFTQRNNYLANTCEVQCISTELGSTGLKFEKNIIVKNSKSILSFGKVLFAETRVYGITKQRAVTSFAEKTFLYEASKFFYTSMKT